MTKSEPNLRVNTGHSLPKLLEQNVGAFAVANTCNMQGRGVNAREIDAVSRSIVQQRIIQNPVAFEDVR